MLMSFSKWCSSATHNWDIVWHIDSEVKKQTDKYIKFADADIAWSNGETTIIAGQETPEWQGFIATGTKQGMYRAVPCVDTKVNANAVRIVTVLAPYPAEEALPFWCFLACNNCGFSI